MRMERKFKARIQDSSLSRYGDAVGSIFCDYFLICNISLSRKQQAWPGIARTVDGNHERFEETYFRKFPGYYFTGDAAFRDNDGYFWITGRTDDLLNVSGHLLSTAEVESALLNDKRISEVAAVSMPHAIKGQCICVYAVTKNGFIYDDDLEKDLRNLSEYQRVA